MPLGDVKLTLRLVELYWEFWTLDLLSLGTVKLLDALALGFETLGFLDFETWGLLGFGTLELVWLSGSLGFSILWTLRL